MNTRTVNENTFRLIEILENVKITYTCGKKVFFDAAYVTKDGVITGRIVSMNKDNRGKKNKSSSSQEVFIECGYIPMQKIGDIKGDIKKNIFLKKR